MESQQDIVDLTINDDDDCFFLTEPPNKTATAKKNHESVNACKSEVVKVSMDRKTVK